MKNKNVQNLKARVIGINRLLFVFVIPQFLSMYASSNRAELYHPALIIEDKPGNYIHQNVTALLPTNLTTSISSNLSLENSSASSMINVNYPNWAGYIVPEFVAGISSSWVVQEVNATFGSTYSSQWAGIGGISSEKTLIQVGTSSDAGISGSYYFAWFECINEYECNSSKGVENSMIIIPNATVKPNDLMHASIKLINSSDNEWELLLNDTTQHWQFKENVTYDSERFDADFIEERILHCNYIGGSCNLTSLADFGLSRFGFDNTKLIDTAYIELTNTTLFRPIGTESTIYKFYIAGNKTNTILATPDPITPDGTSFGVTYGNLSVHALANKTIAHFGDKVSINATVSGGTGPFAYQWYTANQSFGLTPLHFKSAATNSLRATVTGNTIYVVYVTDTGAQSPNPVAYDYVIVNTTASNSTSPNNLNPPTISPSSPILDLGQSIQLHAAESEIPKSGSLVWQWYTIQNNIPTAIPNATYTSLNVNGILSNATYEVSVASTVGSGNAVFSAPDNVIVFPHFITPTITPSNPTITKGQSVTLTASESGSTGIFSYQWYTVANSMITPISNATAMTLSVSPNSTTSYEVQVTDTGTIANAGGTTYTFSRPVTIYWYLSRRQPPNGIMPSVSISNVTA